MKIDRFSHWILLPHWILLGFDLDFTTPFFRFCLCTMYGNALDLLDYGFGITPLYFPLTGLIFCTET